MKVDFSIGGFRGKVWHVISDLEQEAGTGAERT
jgi:hypothetical protein